MPIEKENRTDKKSKTEGGKKGSWSSTNWDMKSTNRSIKLTISHQEALLGGDILRISEIVVLIENICISDPVNKEIIGITRTI